MNNFEENMMNKRDNSVLFEGRFRNKANNEDINSNKKEFQKSNKIKDLSRFFTDNENNKQSLPILEKK